MSCSLTTNVVATLQSVYVEDHKEVQMIDLFPWLQQEQSVRSPAWYALLSTSYQSLLLSN